MLIGDRLREFREAKNLSKEQQGGTRHPSKGK